MAAASVSAVLESRLAAPLSAPLRRAIVAAATLHLIIAVASLVVPRLLQEPAKPVEYVAVSIEEFAAAAYEQHVPTEVVELLSYLFAEVLDGRNAHLMDGVQRALGREPGDFSDYAREAAASGVWAP